MESDELLQTEFPLPSTTAIEKTAGQAVVPLDPLRRYMAELRQFGQLTAEEEQELATRYRERGDTQAAYRLITSHLKLVVRMAMEFRRSWLNVLDLIQEKLQVFDLFTDGIFSKLIKLGKVLQIVSGAVVREIH